MNRLLVLILGCWLTTTPVLFAQLDGDWNEGLTYTTSFFGPNAFPVPELNTGLLRDHSHVELSSDVFWGFGDQTQSLFLRLDYAAIPGVLTFSGWGVLMEHYRVCPELRDRRAARLRSLDDFSYPGDFYLSTQLSLLRDHAVYPDVSVEVVLKTASSWTVTEARFFDSPGYYFNASFGKTYSEAFFVWRPSVELGFLSYQLGNGMQNDSPLYGLQLECFYGNLSVGQSLAGYKGWTGEGDEPLVLRTRFAYNRAQQSYFIQYQHALQDYPFHRIQCGLRWSFRTKGLH